MPENHDPVNSGIHAGAVIKPVWRCTLEAVIKPVWRCTLEAVFKRVWRCTWRPLSSEFGDAIGGHDQATLEMHLEAIIRHVYR